MALNQLSELTSGSKYEAYARRFDPAMAALALVFLGVWSARIIAYEVLPHSVRVTLLAVQGWIWIVFLVDLIIRTVLSEKSWRYLWTHPLDVIAVLLPAARPLKILSVFTQGTSILSSQGRMKTMQAVVLSTILLLWIGSVWVLSAEREVADSAINTFGDALWWAFVTVTTVGYGDYAPVSVTGRMVAGGMMLLGIALIGVVTASVAAWFVSVTSGDEEEKRDAEEADRDMEALQIAEERQAEMLGRIQTLEAKIDVLLAHGEHPDAIRGTRSAGSTSAGASPEAPKEGEGQ
ncbi:potassium channel family protein [Demequina zhanjiangensis]|uniref:Potassium channel family protein n=1 Tax=Demequina zhanjiangensis TaxID=3051659 RepID=A0ABT8G0S9_9MICO|nr:potassium channel family protein [Demequina sp. SYSU T00b26]MDN4472554.1 potassium channel family protein [Demequina sp. SYSU T00b26]